MLNGYVLDRYCGGWTLMISMKHVKRFKIGCEDSSCHLYLLLLPEMLTMLDLPTSGDLLGMTSQLDLTPFGVGVPSSRMAQFPLS